MRERLTAAFVLLTLVLLVAAGAVRDYTLQGRVTESEGESVTQEATVLAQLLDQRLEDGRRVDEGFLAGFADGSRIELWLRGRDAVQVTGVDFDADAPSVSATMPVRDGSVTLERATPDLVSWGDRLGMELGLLALAGVIAGVVGYLVARGLSEPFRQLATAAGALGRGRFDLDLPPTRNPEAAAISRALELSATQLREGMEREQRFAVHTSHALRTPLTGLRLELEELVGSDDLSPESRQAARRGLASVAALDAAAGELVQLSRNPAIVAGAEVPLREVAAATAQRWADVMAGKDREVTAAVEGDIELLVTPGPVETVLDLILEDTVRHGGDIRLVVRGEDSLVRLQLSCEHTESQHGHAPTPLVDGASTVVHALGGRVEDRNGGTDIDVLLPRR